MGESFSFFYMIAPRPRFLSDFFFLYRRGSCVWLNKWFFNAVLRDDDVVKSSDWLPSNDDVDPQKLLPNSWRSHRSSRVMSDFPAISYPQNRQFVQLKLKRPQKLFSWCFPVDTIWMHNWMNETNDFVYLLFPVYTTTLSLLWISHKSLVLFWINEKSDGKTKLSNEREKRTSENVEHCEMK